MTVSQDIGSSSRLRVAHVVISDAFAGTERYVADLAAEQARQGCEVLVLGGDLNAMQKASGCAAVEYFRAESLTEAFRALRASRQLDVVHAHLTASEFAACTAYPRRGPIVVSTRHIVARRGSTLTGRLASRWIRKRLDGQITPSVYAAGLVDGQSHVIATGTPDADFGSHDERVVLVAQRLEADKDTVTAIRAWHTAELWSQGWELHVAGDGSEAHQLTRLVERLGLANSCRFLGRVSDLPRRIARAGLVLCSSRSDSFGLVAVEAMAAGAAVVATASGGYLETVGSVASPALFPPGDHSAAAREMRRLATNAEERGRYGARLREAQRAHFSLPGFASSVIEWYVSRLAAAGLAQRSYQVGRR